MHCIGMHVRYTWYVTIYQNDSTTGVLGICSSACTICMPSQRLLWAAPSWLNRSYPHTSMAFIGLPLRLPSQHGRKAICSSACTICMPSQRLLWAAPSWLNRSYPHTSMAFIGLPLRLPSQHGRKAMMSLPHRDWPPTVRIKA